MKRNLAIVLVLLVAFIVMMFCARDRKRFFSHEGVVWTTDYHITYEASRDLNDSIQFILNQMDMSVSPYNKASLISALNEGSMTRVDGYIKRLLEAARIVNQESGGAYDPTVMPLVNAWGFGYKSGALPSRAHLDSILQFVGMDKVELRGDTLVKHDPRLMLDFSSIAKGMACDEIGRMLARNGAVNWLVEIGGEVMASGVNQRGKTWVVSVDMPTDEQEGEGVSHESALTLTLDSSAIATSGNYRKWRLEGGNKLSHIIDPRTGDSQAGTLLSATVVASDCMTADAWATACMVMGEEKVKNMMQGRNDLGVMTISADTVSGNLVVWSNAAFAKRIN
ncbi:MAG: FAD:protein FMN transferase [Muribaculaceae bacterium]|nr:FAD:protein FMN transferase [Muribaculaceae bacterium]